jgi:hypothetical protein
MKKHISAWPEYSRGAGRHTSTDFGLSEEEIRGQVAAYMDQFDHRSTENFT